MRIALVGDRMADHPSHRELDAVRPQLGVESAWLPTSALTVADLGMFDGIWLVPGSPYASDAAAYLSIAWARENDVPFLGTCGGMQYTVIELTRSLLGITTASHAESDGPGESNVVVPLACSLQGQERLVRPVAGTRFSRLVGDRPFTGMHYCGYAPTAAAIARLGPVGVEVQATADDAGAEVIALTTRRFFMASLFQPQVGAASGKPLHPLLSEFVRSVRDVNAVA